MRHEQTLAAMAEFPQRLCDFFEAVPPRLWRWAPPSWDGVPSESLTALEQVCHVHDIEIEGYQRRFRRLLDDEQPLLPSIDGYALVRERDYAAADPAEALRRFGEARAATLRLLRGLDEAQLRRQGSLEGYGEVTLGGLVHYLCSHDQQHLAGLQWLLGKMQRV